jgi:GAF domain-containing protein
MTQDRFMEILAAYGADPRHWPEAEREAAERFASQNSALIAQAQAEEAQLDRLLGVAERQPSDLLQRRLMQSLPQASRHFGHPAFRAPIAAAAALLIGVCIGFASGAFTAPSDDMDSLYADAFSGLDEDWIDWLEGEA